MSALPPEADMLIVGIDAAKCQKPTYLVGAIPSVVTSDRATVSIGVSERR
jgi:hypothetical protein